jgi:hypothetical protein
MYLMTAEASEAYAGNYFADDYSFTVRVNPQSGFSHMAAVRAQGAMRGYHAGFDGENQVSLFVNDFGFKKLASCRFEWRPNQTYEFKLTAVGDAITLCIDGEQVLQVTDDTFRYGMYGVSTLGAARAYYSDVKVQEL